MALIKLSRRAAAAALAAALTIPALTGCDAQPGLAAKAGDWRVTERQVLAIASELKAFSDAVGWDEQGGQVNARQVLAMLIKDEAA
ncbi:MAG: hypothetical protein LBO20_01895, partial [Bifidobacteriaceae bacterium]|nr:hypothetical protein [Bifidobacteriaceae bacterium]